MESPIEHGRLWEPYFKNYISDKGIKEKILTENAVPSNL